ncbi:MAG: NAD(P)-binding domain-containing protein [Thermoleophilia bacterium]|nr:NAD(P)-binding domain-containing protein [Thermoleophilia bacterium]
MARPDDRTVLLNGYRDGVELGVVGAGRMGLAAAPVFAAAGFEVALSSRRGPERLAAVVSDLGSHIRAVPVAEAMAAPIVMLAVPWPEVEDLLATNATTTGAVLMDATNAWSGWSPTLTASGSSEAVAEWTNADVVKVFSTVHARRLAAPDGLAVPFAADVPNAGDRVADLLSRIGFAPVYAGSLADVADTMAPGGLLFGRTTSDSVLRTFVSGSI